VELKRKIQTPASNGWHSAVVAEIQDLGTKQTKWGPREKLALRYLVDEKDESGKPIQVKQQFTASIEPSSNFFKTVTALTGQEPGDTYNTNALQGLFCEIQTTQRTTPQGLVFANVTDVRPLDKGKPRVAIPLNTQPVAAIKPNGGQPYTMQSADPEIEFPGN
jgi:hypothetical protein